MTVKRLTKRRTKLEKQDSDVIADLIGGKTQAEVAQKYLVSRSAVNNFIDRHRESISALQLEVGRQVESYAIAHKVYRIATLDGLLHRSMDFLQQQGFSEEIERFNRDGEIVSRTQRYRADTIAQLRGLLNDAALERGDRSSKGDTTNIAAVVNIIRGGTPLGMAPLPDVIDATVSQLTEATEDIG